MSEQAQERRRPAQASPQITITYVAAMTKRAVYVGRKMPRFSASPLGNPYRADEHEDPIGLFRRHLFKAITAYDQGVATSAQEAAVVELHRLRRQLWESGTLELACLCAPEPCHADIIASAVIWLSERDGLVELGAGRYAMWDREGVEIGVPWVVVEEYRGKILRQCSSLAWARAPLASYLFPRSLVQTVAAD